MSPEIAGPLFVTVDATMIAMYCGMVDGGGVELPGSVVQFMPQLGVAVESSKPLKAAGPVPPLSELFFHHCAPQKFTDSPTAFATGPTVRSPTTKVPPTARISTGMLRLLCTSAASFELTVAVFET